MEENGLCAVPGHVSRLADAEQTALTDAWNFCVLWHSRFSVHCTEGSSLSINRAASANQNVPINNPAARSIQRDAAGLSHSLFCFCFFSEVLTERVDKKWVCSNSHSFGSSDGFFNKGLTTAVLK